MFVREKRTVLFAIVALGSIAFLAAGQDLREEFHQTYPLTAAGRVSLSNINGAVHVAAWDRSEVKLDAVKRARTQEALSEAEIVVEARADAIEISTKYPEHQREKEAASVEYTLMIPKAAKVDGIKTVNGAVDVEGIAGAVKVSSVNGSVNGRRLGGEVDLSTVNGRVEAELERVESARSVSLRSVNGEVMLKLPQDAGARLSASTVHGTIDSDFDLPVRKIRPGVGQDVAAVIGNGGPDVQMRTVNGSLHVARR